MYTEQPQSQERLNGTSAAQKPGKTTDEERVERLIRRFEARPLTDAERRTLKKHNRHMVLFQVSLGIEISLVAIFLVALYANLLLWSLDNYSHILATVLALLLPILVFLVPTSLPIIFDRQEHKYVRLADAFCRARQKAWDGALGQEDKVFLLNESGRLAQRLFRVITGRRFNAGSRPELSDAAYARAAKTMLNAADVDSIDRAMVATYRSFIGDMAGLVAVGRLELVDVAVQDLNRDNPDVLAKLPPDDAIREYLQPMLNTSRPEIVVKYVVPCVALLISIVALLVSLF